MFFKKNKHGKHWLCFLVDSFIWQVFLPINILSLFDSLFYLLQKVSLKIPPTLFPLNTNYTCPIKLPSSQNSHNDLLILSLFSCVPFGFPHKHPLRILVQNLFLPFYSFNLSGFVVIGYDLLSLLWIRLQGIIKPLTRNSCCQICTFIEREREMNVRIWTPSKQIKGVQVFHSGLFVWEYECV